MGGDLGGLPTSSLPHAHQAETCDSPSLAFHYTKLPMKSSHSVSMADPQNLLWDYSNVIIFPFLLLFS